MRGAVEAMKGVVERAKATAEKASSALAMLHEGVFLEKEVPTELEALAGSFDAEGGFLADFARDHTVRGLETTLMVFLGHGVSINYNCVASLIPEISDAQSTRAVDIARRLLESLERHAKEQGGSSP